jgi:multiple sugar transport system substrate-binding protein
MKTFKRIGTGLSATRRDVLKGLAALGAVGALPGNILAQERTAITWWDVFQPLIPLHEKLWAQFSVENPIDVEYTGMNPSDMMQALQLAARSNQSPDVFNVPESSPAMINSLQSADWFAPLPESFKFDAPFQKEVTAEGFTTFDGRLHSFPIFSFRWNATSLWYFADKLDAAGFDPALGPQSWDEARRAALAMTGDGSYGLILPLQFAVRMRDHLEDLAKAAGASGAIDWKTGEYAYASQPFLDAMEFLRSFHVDGSLHPASSSVDARQGRARWAAGEAAMFFDGPWNSGVLNNSFAEVIDRIDVCRVPYPTTAEGSYTTKGPNTGTFWISAQSEHVEEAAQVLQLLTSEEYYIALAERMDQPPLDLSAVERAEVHSTYRKVVSSYADYVRLAPDPLIRNPAVSAVYAEMRDVSPGLGEIIQGAFSGAFDDPQPILQQYNDQMMAERDRAIEVARSNGAEVSQDDWVFENWTPGEDFTSEKY